MVLRPLGDTSSSDLDTAGDIVDDSNVSWSPNGDRVLFTTNRDGNYEIYMAQADGSQIKNLTNSSGYDTQPSWSPDGRQIAFASTKDGNVDIYTISAKGGFPRPLTRETSDESDPSWSRDGRWIYISSDRSGDLEVWKLPAEGGEAIRVTHNGGTVAFESVDGKFLYFGKQPLVPNYEGSRGIWRIPVDGGEDPQCKAGHD